MATFMQNFRSTVPAFLQRFVIDTNGATAVFMAVGLFAMVGSIGIATDAARGYLVKARLSQALDASGLAGARVMFSDTRNDDINMYFDANFPPNYMDSVVAGPNITDISADVLHVAATATVPTTVMRIFGVTEFDVSAETEITRQTQLLDVVIAMDMSTSMVWDANPSGGGGSRIAAARTAAKDLVDILFGSDATKDLLKIGLVPWNSKVNVMLRGTAFDPALTVTEAVPSFTNPVTGAAQSVIYKANNSPVPLLNAPPVGWAGCVYQRHHDNADTTDDADHLLGSLSYTGGDWVAWEPVTLADEPSEYNGVTYEGTCSNCRPCLTATNGLGEQIYGITPLTSTKSVIDDAIDKLEDPVGRTNIPGGLGWAWRVLVPDAPFTEADANPPGKRQQAIILLTDGQNWGGYGDGYKDVFGTAASPPGMDDRLQALATNIKAAGIQLYVIQFFHNSGALATLLKGVASSPDAPFYHFAPDAASLQTVFKEVANHLSELRLSK